MMCGRAGGTPAGQGRPRCLPGRSGRRSAKVTSRIADVSDNGVWRTIDCLDQLSPARREQDLLGQTVLVIGGSSGIGLETARLARAKGADIILTAATPDRLHRAGLELEASIAAFDATDFDRLQRFFGALPAPIDHLLVTGPGPYYAPLAEFDLDAARHDIDAHLLLPLQVAKNAASNSAPGHPAVHGRRRRPPPGRWPGVHVGAHGRAPCHDREPRGRGRARPGRPDRGRLCRHAAVSLAARPQDRPAPRAAPCHAADRPRRRPADIAALAVHLMTNTAITGATFDIDGGQQLVQG